jgi:hypothetical protein
MTSISMTHRTAFLVALLAAAVGAQARDKVLLLPVAGALADPAVQHAAGATPMRFGSASATNAELLARDVQIDGSAAPLRENQTQRDSQAPSDESVCQKAFADAMARLSEAARKAGASAVLGIVSDFKGQVHDDAANVECHAGSFHSYVSLRAQFARSLPHTLPVPAKSGFAESGNVDAVPLSAAGKERYAHFLTLPRPRAFAVAEDGSWRFWADDPDAMTKALDDCARAGKRCWLYAVDDRVVWDADAGRRIASSAQLRAAAAPVAAKDEHQ